MSVHRIYYSNGVKMMAPVLSREEYMALRDSEQNRAAEKKKMVQMNYSCLPNEDGTLKGAKRMSMTVGMDIDLDPQAPLKGDVEEKILAMKEQIGLLMLEQSATKGYHIVFRRHPEMTQEENLRWMSKQIGVPYDKGAKDITRVFYTPADKLIWLDDEVFSLSPAPTGHLESRSALAPRQPSLFGVPSQGTPPSQGEREIRQGKGGGGECGGECNSPVKGKTVPPSTAATEQCGDKAVPPSTAATEQCGDNRCGGGTTQPCGGGTTQGVRPTCYPSGRTLEGQTPQCSSDSECSEAAPISATEREANEAYNGIPFADIVGKYWEMFNDGKEPREGDRNVKTYELAMTIRSICDYSAEKMMQVIPRYDGFPEEEYRKTIENAANEQRKGMPYRLKQVLAALKKEAAVKVTGGTMTTPPPMPKRLPPLVRLLTRNVPAFYKPAVASCVFPALGTHMHGARFRYWDNVEHEPTFMNVLIGRQSVGKGCIKKPVEYILQDIVKRDEPNREREAEWKRKNPSGKSKAKDPRPSDICIQILIDNLTDAVFNQRVVDAHNNGQRFVYTQVDEIEGLKKVTSRGTVDEVSLLIRKAFDNSMAGQERVGADSVSGIAPLRWNWNASTTPPNAKKFFVKAVGDGTVGRLDIATIMLTEEEEDETPVMGIYDDAFAAELKPYIDRLEAASGLVECPQAITLSKALKEENKAMAKLCESEAYKVFSYRANVIAWLKGMVLYVAHGYRWSKEIAEFVRWSQAYNLWCKMVYFGAQLEEELKEEKAIQRTAGPQDLLALMPDSFTQEEYRQMRLTQGREGDGRDTLRQWKSREYIEWDEIQECWHKTKLYLERHP